MEAQYIINVNSSQYYQYNFFILDYLFLYIKKKLIFNIFSKLLNIYIHAFLFLKRGIFWIVIFCENYLTDLLFCVPVMYNTFFVCQRYLTHVLFWTLVALIADTYRGNICTIDRIVFRFTGGILFFFVLVFTEAFLKNVMWTIVLQIVQSHLLPEHFTLISLEHAHVFTAVFIRQIIKHNEHNRNEGNTIFILQTVYNLFS